MGAPARTESSPPSPLSLGAVPWGPGKEPAGPGSLWHPGRAFFPSGQQGQQERWSGRLPTTPGLAPRPCDSALLGLSLSFHRVGRPHLLGGRADKAGSQNWGLLRGELWKRKFSDGLHPAPRPRTLHCDRLLGCRPAPLNKDDVAVTEASGGQAWAEQTSGTSKCRQGN